MDRFLIIVLRELEEKFNMDSLDVEFALTEKEKLYLFQVRPLVLCGQAYLSTEDQKRVLGLVKEKYNAINKPHPYLYGLKTIFGVMPDWNPAEIIGKRPNPLALSFYKELITDSIWAYQRSNYGYKNLRSFPLLISFAGLPYIDVRVSFNSFLPKELGPALAEKLVNYYIEQFCKNPANHDKVEFNIIFSCYTLDLPERIKKLVEYGFGEKECVQLLKNLKSLTNRITKNNGLWKIDIEKISELEARQDEITKGDLDIISKIYWLLEDCKRYGTLPFAGLSRAAFVAVQLLKSMNNTKIISENDYDCFMMSLNTVGSQMTSDILKMSKINFQKKYGHLRPNTYNVLSPRYDEEPDRYFNWSCSKKVASDPTGNERKFSLSLDQKRKLDEMLIQHELEHDVVSIFKFLKGAIEGREYSKFVFTKSLSDMMSLFVKLGEEYGFSREDISFADINIIKEIYSASSHPKAAIEKSIQSGKEMYEATCQISLPSVISSENDIFFFNLQENEPNFITQNVATGTVVTKDYDYSKLRGVILFIPSADPGYDWIFSHGIVGFVTMYGGANSHMAIRAGEMGIPAVIGAGESLYQMWSEAKLLEVDCANKLVRILQ